jgi:Flp pilus assembly protein TadD
MITAMGLAVWRAVLLVALGLAPWGAPLEASAAGTATTGAALLRLALAAAAVAAAAYAVRAVRPREPWALGASLALAGAAVLLSSFYSGDRGPLARGVWIASPIAWIFVAAIATDIVARARGVEGSRAPVRRAVIAASLALSGVSLLAAQARLSPRDHLWEAVLAADPGDEPAALAVAAAKRASGDVASSGAVLRACSEASAAACRCAEKAAADAFDLGDYASARATLERGAACSASSARAGALAEVLVGTGDLDGGLARADEVLQRKADEPHALYAHGWVLWLRGDVAGARPWVARAVDAGRGLPAQILLGSILFQQGDEGGAGRAFRAALVLDPKNARATYDLALIAHQRGQYHDAREGYLAALHLDPKYLEARYNLVLLTHAHGADAEAQHHFVEFALAAPNDPRVAELRAALATPNR